VRQGPLQKGGGHNDKQVMELAGGLGVVAKLALTSNAIQQEQVRAECAAPILARALGWGDLVPVTAMRAVVSRATGEYVPEHLAEPSAASGRHEDHAAQCAEATPGA